MLYNPQNNGIEHLRVTRQTISVDDIFDHLLILLCPKNLEWHIISKSRFIESLLIRLPLHSFYISELVDGSWLVIDGTQRLQVLEEFITSPSFRLTGLEFFPELNGKSFLDLSLNYCRRILETDLTVFLIEKTTPLNIKHSLYNRIQKGHVRPEFFEYH